VTTTAFVPGKICATNSIAINRARNARCTAAATTARTAIPLFEDGSPPRLMSATAVAFVVAGRMRNTTTEPKSLNKLIWKCYPMLEKPSTKPLWK
jgi:hypothetical protein